MGPWTFRFVPGASAIDPINVRAAIGETRTISGFSVTAGSLAFSSAGALLDATFQYDPSLEFQFPEPPRLVYPDGTVVHAGGPLGHAPLPGKAVSVQFPPGKDIPPSAKIDFGPVAQNHYQPQRVDIPVSVGIPASGALVINEARFDVTVQTSSAGLRVAITPANPAAQDILFTLGGVLPTLVDDTGRSYTFLNGGGKVRREGDTLVFVGHALYFSGSVGADARMLTLTLPGYSAMVQGPWSFTVQVAK